LSECRAYANRKRFDVTRHGSVEEFDPEGGHLKIITRMLF
jgi:hypothetical protein